MSLPGSPRRRPYSYVVLIHFRQLRLHETRPPRLFDFCDRETPSRFSAAPTDGFPSRSPHHRGVREPFDFTTLNSLLVMVLTCLEPPDRRNVIHTGHRLVGGPLAVGTTAWQVANQTDDLRSVFHEWAGRYYEHKGLPLTSFLGTKDQPSAGKICSYIASHLSQNIRTVPGAC